MLASFENRSQRRGYLMALRYLLLSALILTALPAVSPAQTDAGLKVRHIHIWVKDVERTKVFYRDKMGFKVSHETPGANVEFNDGTLWFGKFKGTGSPSTNAITIGLGTPSVQAAYDALKKNGAPVAEPPSEAHGEWHFTLKDPDGYEIEVEGPK
jgi:catechol 2,3-dioxygenase-like lactoylglutathione lyase family enzyme